MMKQVAANEYETKAFELEISGKTFRIAGHRNIADYYTVTSHLTAKPSAKGFWGCKVFSSLAEIESNYKNLKGITVLLRGEL